MNMNIKINLEIEKKGNNYIVGNLTALNILLGSKAAAGNLWLYKIKKENNQWIVPKVEVIKRLKYKRERVVKELKEIELMNQILKS